MRILILLLAFLCGSAQAGPTYNVPNPTASFFSPCFPVYSSTSPEDVVTGITGGLTNFQIKLQQDNNDVEEDYTTTGDILTIAIIGTYATPTNADEIRWGECDASSGTYQVQIRDEELDDTNTKMVTICWNDTGTTLMHDCIYLDQNIATAEQVAQENWDHAQSASVGAGTFGEIATEIALLLVDLGEVLDATSVFSGQADSGNNFSFVDAALTEADAGYWARNTCVTFTSGNIDGQTVHVDNFTPGSDTIAFSPLTTQAVGTNTYTMAPCFASP